MKKLLYWLLILILSCTLQLKMPNQSCFAQDKIKPKQEEVKTTFKSDSLINPLVVFSNLLALIVIMLLLAWLFNRLNGSRLIRSLSGNKSSKRDMINILSTTSLGQGKFLHVVEVGGQKILIGSTSSNISMLKEIKEEIYYEKVDFNE